MSPACPPVVANVPWLGTRASPRTAHGTPRTPNAEHPPRASLPTVIHSIHLSPPDGFRAATLFVATDSSKFLTEIEALYPGRVVSRPALRSESNAFLDSSLTDNYQKGADALIDAMLLSRADFLLK